jgi:hypothetical protein
LVCERREAKQLLRQASRVWAWQVAHPVAELDCASPPFKIIRNVGALA